MLTHREEHGAHRFACDAMHGGLARWLRAAGYDATWSYGIDDGVLLQEAEQEGRIVVTSDSGILLRRRVTQGAVIVQFVPRGLSVDRQLAHVASELGLTRRDARCMKCGGALCAIPKESVAGEAPPKAYAWVDQFWRCSRCAALLWRGTHWLEIERRLAAAMPRSAT